MSRRTLLAGIAAVAGCAGGAEAMPPALSSNDARLLSLAAEATRAADRHSAACVVEDEGAPGCVQEGPSRVMDAAFDAWEAVLYAMAEIPADGLPGVAAKLGHVLLTLETGQSGADLELADSLRADVARLAPAACHARRSPAEPLSLPAPQRVHRT